MAGEQKHSSQLEQFMLLAKKAQGSALIALVNQLLEAPGVYVFGEFLELPCMRELASNPNRGYSQLLNIFAYGTYHDYKAFVDTLPPLNDNQRNKLRQLSIANLAASMQVIPYSVLLKELELVSVRQLEDLLIEGVYADVIRGKLDQHKQHLEVDSCISRDIPPEGIARIANTLSQWCSNCEMVLTAVEQQVDRVTKCREAQLEALHQTETEVGNIRQQICATPSTSSQELVQQEGEGAMARPSQGAERRHSLLRLLSMGKSLTSQKH